MAAQCRRLARDDHAEARPGGPPQVLVPLPSPRRRLYPRLPLGTGAGTPLDGPAFYKATGRGVWGSFMKVAEVMSRGFDPVDPAATVQAAATQMAELDVGAVLVGTPEKIEGILTDRDIILRLVVDGRNPAEVPVKDVMSSTIFSCRADDLVQDAFAQMRERQIRRMPVLNEEGRPIGIVTFGDLAKAIESPEQIREHLREISEPHRSRKATETDEPVESDDAPPAQAAELEASPEAVAGRP